MKNNNSFKNLFDNLKSFKIDSIKQENNTILIGKNSKLIGHLGPTIGYLHVLFHPISIEIINFLNNENNYKFSDELIKFYSEFNGFNLYSGAFKIFGSGYIKTAEGLRISRDEKNVLPIHISIENLLYQKTNKLFLGTYGSNEICLIGSEVSLLSKQNIINKWGSIYDCFRDLLLELESQYVDGVCLKPIKIKNLVFNKPI
jgi:hypothetical protein